MFLNILRTEALKTFVLSHLSKDVQITTVLEDRDSVSVQEQRADLITVPCNKRSCLFLGQTLVRFAYRNYQRFGFLKLGVSQPWCTSTACTKIHLRPPCLSLWDLGSGGGSNGTQCKHEVHAACSAARNKVLFLWTGILMVSASIH